MNVAEHRYKAVLAVIADGRTVTEVARSWGVPAAEDACVVIRVPGRGFHRALHRAGVIDPARGGGVGSPGSGGSRPGRRSCGRRSLLGTAKPQASPVAVGGQTGGFVETAKADVNQLFAVPVSER